MENQILNLSKRLISVASTRENPKLLSQVLDISRKEITEYKVKEFEKDGIPSLMVSNKETNEFKVVLNAHLDVVPAKEAQYKPVVKGERLHGRGAYDMKAAAATMILLYRELGNKVKYPLGLQLVTDEEIGGFYGTKYQIKKGVRADFVIAGEPTDFGVNNKAKGVLWLKIKSKGKSAHGAYPWEGQNAIEKINSLLNLLYKEFPVPKSEVWKTTLNVSKIETTNSTFNKVPDETTIWLDVRFVPEEQNTIVNRLKKLTEGFTFEIVIKEPPQFTDGNNKYLQALRHATKEVTGRLPPIISKHGGSDIRHFNQVGCAGVTFGPKGAGMHTDNEWVDIKSLQDYYNILEKFLLSI